MPADGARVGHALHGSDVDRFRRFLLQDVVTGCWRWAGGKNERGYGHFGLLIDGKRRTVKAHRFAYAVRHGEIPDGLVLDHLCRNRDCCNPDHLEAVEQRENSLRGEHPHYAAHRAGVCLRGHPLTGHNARRNSGGICCRQCESDRRRDRRATAIDDALSIVSLAAVSGLTLAWLLVGGGA